jgi:hypothetical protein
MSSTPQDAPKKQYKKPVLKVHGNVQTLTATVGFIAHGDGGSGSMARTH